jgi:hypothetical protein
MEASVMGAAGNNSSSSTATPGMASSPSNAAGSGIDMGTSTSNNNGGGMSTFIYPPGIASSEDIRAYHIKIQTETAVSNSSNTNSIGIVHAAGATAPPDPPAVFNMTTATSTTTGNSSHYYNAGIGDGSNDYEYDYDDAGPPGGYESFEEELERESVDVSRQSFYAAAEKKQKQSQQDQYRKLFVNLRKGLKPREHPVSFKIAANVRNGLFDSFQSSLTCVYIMYRE